MDVRVRDSDTMTIEEEDDVFYVGIPAAPAGGLGDEKLTSPVIAQSCSGPPFCTGNPHCTGSPHCTGNHCGGCRSCSGSCSSCT
jgi:hypothetical protein